MTDQEIWNCETPVAELLGVNVPSWIEQDIAASTIASIAQGGCASGAYMPAVTYWTASDVMAAYGDDVLDYIHESTGELPTSCAVELLVKAGRAAPAFTYPAPSSCGLVIFLACLAIWN
jgi:hypothetical protein